MIAKINRIGISSFCSTFGFLLLGVFLCVVVLISAASDARAAEGACPNEARRLEQGEPALALPECRAYEQVSPPGAEPFFVTLGSGAINENLTSGGSINIGTPKGALASAQGDAFAYFSSVAPSGSRSDGPFFLSRRGASGWSTSNLVPPQSTEDSVACLPHVDAWSNDFSTHLLADGWNIGANTCGADKPALVAGEPRGAQNLFLHTADGSYRLVNITPDGVAPANAEFVGASADLSHVVFRESARLTPDAPPVETREIGKTSDFYEYLNGSLRLITVLPSGLPVEGAVAETTVLGANTLASARNVVSADGEEVVWETQSAPPGEPVPTALYVRLNAGQPPTASGECTPVEPQLACTVRVDAVQEGASGEGKAFPVFCFSSTDGTRVFFTDEQRLTSDSTASAGAPDLYEFNFERPEGQRLADLSPDAGEPADVLGVAGLSEDGTSVYFAAEANLTGSEQNSQGSSALGAARGTGVASGAVQSTGTVEPDSATVTNLHVTEGEFHTGQEIEPQTTSSFPVGTTILACSPDCSAPTELQLSNPWKGNSASGLAITGIGSPEISGLTNEAGTFVAGMSITGSGIPPNTTITAVGPGSLTLSRGALANGSVELTAAVANLYRRTGGHDTYIASLTPGPEGGDQCDWGENDYSLGVGRHPNCLTSRVSPNGKFIAFNSIRPLTGIDNTPPEPKDCLNPSPEHGVEPQHCQEVFVYDAGEGSLQCASCSSDSSPPTGPAYIPYPNEQFIPNQNPSPYRLYRNLSNKGAVFFNTDSALLPADENGTSDVYEYASGGLSLISSGKDPSPSYFYEASESGDDVFFLTAQPLLTADTDGEMSIYDARVDGGFPEPPPAPECEGESCRGPATGPSASATPGTGAFSGPEEGPGHPQKASCRKGFVKKHGKCVKKHKKHSHHQHRRGQ